MSNISKNVNIKKISYDWRKPDMAINRLICPTLYCKINNLFNISFEINTYRALYTNINIYAPYLNYHVSETSFYDELYTCKDCLRISEDKYIELPTYLTNLLIKFQNTKLLEQINIDNDIYEMNIHKLYNIYFIDEIKILLVLSQKFDSSSYWYNFPRDILKIILQLISK